MNTFWYSPPVAVVAYTLVVVALYWLGHVLNEKGRWSVDKHLPYTGGELPTGSSGTFRYHAFFRLALFFVILHVAALVASTLPTAGRFHRIALIYLVGVAISGMVLISGED